MFTDKQTVLSQVAGALNKPGQPWEVTVQGDSIIAYWKWLDATFFGPHEVTDETKSYSFTVILTDKGKWKEIDQTETKSTGVSMKGGNLSIGSSSQKFIGKTSQKSFQLGSGINNQTGEVGLVMAKFDTAIIKKSVREYLESLGWKKAGLFG